MRFSSAAVIYAAALAVANEVPVALAEKQAPSRNRKAGLFAIIKDTAGFASLQSESAIDSKKVNQDQEAHWMHKDEEAYWDRLLQDSSLMPAPTPPPSPPPTPSPTPPPTPGPTPPPTPGPTPPPTPGPTPPPTPGPTPPPTPGPTPPPTPGPTPPPTPGPTPPPTLAPTPPPTPSPTPPPTPPPTTPGECLVDVSNYTFTLPSIVQPYLGVTFILTLRFVIPSGRNHVCIHDGHRL